jgi:uncharacterized protein YbjT (DUF2867 family)
MQDLSALTVGASGYVGGYLLEMALSHGAFASVTALVRRPLTTSHPMLKQRIVDFEQIAEETLDEPITDFFCCLGTTRRTAGSREAFRRVDFDYVLESASCAQRAGAEGCFVVSSVGANPGASNFYLRVKGEMEHALGRLNFRSLHIFRPGLLSGNRAERRPAERAAQVAMPFVQPFLVGGLRRYRSISAEIVAAAMIGAALTDSRGRHIHHNEDMYELTANF